MSIIITPIVCSACLQKYSKTKKGLLNLQEQEQHMQNTMMTVGYKPLLTYNENSSIFYCMYQCFSAIGIALQQAGIHSFPNFVEMILPTWKKEIHASVRSNQERSTILQNISSLPQTITSSMWLNIDWEYYDAFITAASKIYGVFVCVHQFTSVDGKLQYEEFLLGFGDENKTAVISCMKGFMETWEWIPWQSTVCFES